MRGCWWTWFGDFTTVLSTEHMRGPQLPEQELCLFILGWRQGGDGGTPVPVLGHMKWGWGCLLLPLPLWPPFLAISTISYICTCRGGTCASLFHGTSVLPLPESLSGLDSSMRSRHPSVLRCASRPRCWGAGLASRSAPCQAAGSPRTEPSPMRTHPGHPHCSCAFCSAGLSAYCIFDDRSRLTPPPTPPSTLPDTY